MAAGVLVSVTEQGWGTRARLGRSLLCPAPPLGRTAREGGRGVRQVESPVWRVGRGWRASSRGPLPRASWLRLPAAWSQVRQPAARHPGHAPPEPEGGPGGAAPSGRPQRLAPSAAQARWALGGWSQGARHGTGPQRRHPVQVRPARKGRPAGGVRAHLTASRPAQGGSARPGRRHRPRAAAALPLPCALPAQLRAAWRGARPAAPWGPAV